jgi:hypothetical protein
MTYTDNERRLEADERRIYAGFIIGVELYKRGTGAYYALPYVEKSAKGGVVTSTVKKHFRLSNPEFPTKEEAVMTALKECQKKIDSGFDPNSMSD